MIQHFCARKMMIIIIILARALRMSKRMIFHVMHEPIINNSKFQVQELPPIVDAIFNDIMMMGYRLASQCGSITNMRMVLLDFYSSAAIFFFSLGRRSLSLRWCPFIPLNVMGYQLGNWRIF